MKDFYKDKFKYNFDINQKMIHYLIDNEEKLNEKISILTSHILNAHHVWNTRLINKNIVYKVWDIHQYKEMLSIDLENYEDSINAIESLDLQNSIDYKTMLNEPFANTINDILFHIINHSNYHRAQVNSELKNLGLQPVITDFIFYKRQ